MRDTRYEIRHTRKAMTLIEILVAIAIIGVLASIGVIAGKAVYEQAKERSLESTFTTLESAMDEYKEYWGYFPNPVMDPNLSPCENLYDQLNRLPASRKMLEKINASLMFDGDGDDYPEIYDPWDRVLNYKYEPGDHYPEIISSGPPGGNSISSKGK